MKNNNSNTRFSDNALKNTFGVIDSARKTLTSPDGEIFNLLPMDLSPEAQKSLDTYWNKINGVKK